MKSQTHYLTVYDRDPHKDRISQLLEYVRNNSTDFIVRRRYDDRIEYIFDLEEDSITYIHLTYGDIIGARIIWSPTHSH